MHADQKNLWLFAAKWELSESNNIEGALNYLKTGLHHHPDSKELYTESFKLELQSAEKFHNKNSPLEDQQQKASSRATVHFRAAAEMLGHDIEFLVSLLNTATEFEYTEELQAEIIEYLTKHCWRSEIMWHTMAQRELHGHHFNKDDVNKSKTQLCVQIYKHAVQVLPTSQMWERYLDALIEIYHDEKRNKSFKSEILDKSFEDAYNDGFLQEKHYLVWLDIQPDEEKYIGLLKKASEAIPNSLELWLLQMKYYTTRDDLQMVVATAKKAIELLKDDSLQIYACLTKYYQMKTANAQYTLECQKVYESGIENGGTDISLSLRPMYIQWLTLVRSIKFARIEYEKMVTRIPHCLELHKKMIELEQARFNPSIEIIRNVHRTACSQFGASKTEVWMDLIKFEREYGDSKNISDIYNNAKTTLNDNLVSIFMTDFAILNSQ